MKKSFLTVLVLLVLMVSFFAIGCEKDKSSEVVQKYEAMIKDFEEYQKSAKVVDSLDMFIDKVIENLYTGEEQETKEKSDKLVLDDTEDHHGKIENLVLSIIGYDKSIDINSYNGSFEGNSTLKENGIEMSISTPNDIVIKYKEVKGTEETEEKTLNISINLSLVETVDEKGSTETRKYSNIKVKDTTFGDITRVTFYSTETNTTEFREAKIGDKTVDLRLINATR